MKKVILSIGVVLSMNVASVNAQGAVKGPAVPVAVELNKHIPKQDLPAPDVAALLEEDAQRDKNGQLYRIGVPIFTNITPVNSGVWTNLPNGDRVWELKIKSEGAEALSFLFEVFKVYDNSTFEIRDLSGVLRHRPMTKDDVLDHFQQNAALCFGDEFILKLTEPYGSRSSEFRIDQVMYNYRSTGNPNVQKINESEACEVNVNCSPVGDAWQVEKRGVARIYVVSGASAGWCTGSLVNNVTQDCKPLFLTALHCGITNNGTLLSASNFNQWKFYFRYESPNCTNPSQAGTLDDYFITGSVVLAHSNDGGGNSGSDFLLVQLGTLTNQATTITTLKSANFNAYWNGWDANNTATAGGVGIHHPAGDIKKISTFNGNTITSAWNGNGLQSHWRLTWSSNANGYGVTEGGSSGSPIFNNSAGRIVGTLTGGGSFCNATNQPDYYGKMSYHWTSNSTNTNYRLKTFLDPGNTGLLVLDGSADPCSAPAVPVANFSGTPTTVSPGGTVGFTDLTTGSPTGWAWVITPGSAGVDWSYTGGTSATSQNPQVIFNTVGQYNIQLTASNAQGSDVELKNNYITVQVATGPCTPSASNACDEYIQNVSLNTINNTTACTSGGYISYTGQSTTLNKGSQYTVTVTPAIGATVGTAYTDDEIAVWIDYNDDNDFLDAGEQVGYVLVGAGWSNQFTFTVPTGAVTGAVTMRVRISYSVDGAIDPCAVATYGETEDYTVNLQPAPSGVLSLQCGSNQTIYATSSTVMPNVVSAASASTTCPGGSVTVTQTPVAGTALNNGANNVTVSATDQCGNTQTCQVTVTYINNLGIGEMNLFSNVTMFPNPVSEELMIDLSSVSSEEVVIEIYDMSGKLVATNNNENGSIVSVNMSSVANGIYQVKLSTENTQVIRRISKM
ncbi:MAG: GEVED domain-containing protein [Flavobacteriales bacterium]